VTTARRTLAFCIAAAALAACSGGSSSQPHTPDAQRTQLAIAFARQLAASGPHIPGEQVLTDVPNSLRKPGERIGVSNLIIEARYWSAPGTAADVYAKLSDPRSTDLRQSGAGRRALIYFPVPRPSYIDVAELYVEVRPLSNGRTAIAAFAEVAPFLIRRAEETIPISRSKVVISRGRRDGSAGREGTVTLDPAQSAEFVRAFDRARIPAPAACHGGLGPAFGYTAVVTSGAQTWKLSYPGGSNCGRIGVSSRGRSLPEVRAESKLRHLLDADFLGTNGAVSGVLLAVGGPDGTISRNWPGVVQLRRAGRVVATGRADRQGNFEIVAPPGTYTMTGRSPRYDGGHGVCRAEKPVTIKVDGYAYGNVLCQMR
jgi:hypothetical protein